MRIIVPIALLLLVAPACGGSASFDAFQLARTLFSETGALEERAEALTVGLTEALTAPADSPEAAIARLDAYVDRNVDDMNEVARAIAERIATLPPDESFAYTEVMSERMAGPTFAWRDAYFGFIEAHPELEDALREATAPLGTQIPPVERPF